MYGICMEYRPHNEGRNDEPDHISPFAGQNSFETAPTYDSMQAPFFLPTHDSPHYTSEVSDLYLPIDAWRRPDLPPDNPDALYVGLPDGNAYAQIAPTMQEILSGPSRDASIEYWESTTASRQFRYISIPDDARRRTMTESEALINLDDFLLAAPDLMADIDHPDAQAYADEARFIHTHLRFIGSAEFDTATAGVAELWSHYLEEDPKHQIFVPVGSIRMSDYDRKKSDARVFEGVMKHLDPDNQARVVTKPRQVHNRPDTRTVYLDDWSKSGGQLKTGVRTTGDALSKRFPLRGYKGTSEVNLLIASDEQLHSLEAVDGTMPLRAYYHGGPDDGSDHTDPAWSRQKGPTVTGLHSAVDFSFEDPIACMVELYNRHHPTDQLPMPALVNLIRR